MHQTVLPDDDPRCCVPVTVGDGPPIEAAKVQPYLDDAVLYDAEAGTTGSRRRDA